MPNAAARAACSDLVAQFAICLDLRRFARVAALFTTDGVFHRPNGDVVVGRENIERALAVRPLTLHSVHHVSAPVFDHIGDNEAEAWSSFLGFTRDAAQNLPLALRGGGLFHDRYRRSESGWLIVERIAHGLGEKS